MHTLPKNALWDNAFTVDPTVQELSYCDNVSEDVNDDSADDDSNDDDSDNDDSNDDHLVVNLGKRNLHKWGLFLETL
jgi:hypothetical protein